MNNHHDPTALETATWLDQEDRRVTDAIRQHGCFIQGVLGDPRPGHYEPEDWD